MAETKKEGDNPFSFKSFMKRNSTDVGETRGPQERIRTRKKRDSKKTSEVDDIFGEDDTEKGTGKKDNPFSFTKFVKTKKRSQTTAIPLVTGNSSEDSSSELDDLFSPPPAKETSHRARAHTIKETKLSTLSDPLSKADIFESDSDSSFGLTEEDSLLFKKSSNTPIDLGPPLTNVPDTQVVSNGKVCVAIPLTGGKKEEDSDSFGSSLEGEAKDVLSRLPSTPGESERESALVKKLKAENKKLKSELKQSQQEAKKQKEKNSSLKDELRALKVKESEDTKALEDMVQKVESNLVATTKRAVSAEATINKLKQEIQSLQVQLAQASPQSVHHKYEEMLQGVREKASFASTQLVAASQKADQSIRELVSGVETLKNVSEILMFIDSITEIKDKPNT